MKRSEAVAQLAGYLSTYHWYEEKHPEELLELAECALTGIEKIGMLPPAELARCIKGINPEYNHATVLFTWDMEDE